MGEMNWREESYPHVTWTQDSSGERRKIHHSNGVWGHRGGRKRKKNVKKTWLARKARKEVWSETEEGPTYPPLNLPSVRQATSRERPAPMIKLVGFNISGIPAHGNRNNQRDHDQNGGSQQTEGAKRGQGERRIKTKQSKEGKG